MADESLFRFLLVRAGKHTGRRAPDPTRLPLYPKDPSPFSKSISDLEASGSAPGVILRAVEGYRASAAYVARVDGLDFDIAKGLGWLSENTRRDLSAWSAAPALKSLYGEDLGPLTSKPAFAKTFRRIADTLFAEGLSPRAALPDREALVAAFKLMTVMTKFAGGVPQPTQGTLGQWIQGVTLLIPRPVKSTAPAPNPPPPPPPPPPKPDPRRLAEERLALLESAHRELSRLAVDGKALIQSDVPTGGTVRPGSVAGSSGGTSGTGTTTGHSPTVEMRISALESTRLAGLAGNIIVEAVRLGGVLNGLPETPLRFNPKAFESVSDNTKKVLADLKIDVRSIHPTALIGRVEEEMSDVARFTGGLPTNSRILIGGVMIDRDRLRDSLFGPGVLFGPPAMPHVCEFKAGVGDLLIVRQKLKAYELGEFAHVENVLKGESRLREHRRLELQEETQTTEEETETEKERDLQSTERNEMQSEANKTVKSQFQLEAGLQVSGSYGPTVSFSANLGTSFSTSTEESQRKSVSYSREVTDKTSEKVRERMKKSLTRRTLNQTEELNRHGIENAEAGAKHIRGIYRWLNKVYDAQIMNYGQRMMYEFVVPEPAHFFLYAMVENPPKDNEIIKPDPPRYGTRPLKPTDLTRTNYVDWVAQYQVRNVQAPPPEFQDASYFDKQDKTQDGSTFGRAGKVDIPAGYEAFAATVMTDYTFTENEEHAFHVMLGNTSFDRTLYWGCSHKTLDRRYKELSIAYHLWRAWSFSVAIDVHCRITSEGLAKWQQAVFDSIMEAYLTLKSDYDETQAAKAIQQGIPILGRNPLENRRIERDELKKLIIMILTKSTDVTRDSMQPSVPGTAPLMDLDKICENGSWIRFFENAFEWNNIVYVMYPYFWGRAARWITAIHFTDPDPDFAAFLKAGAARVQIPVRPGFEKAVAYFCQFGQIWEGGDPPLRDDDTYVPIVDEIAENLGKLDDGVPYPEGSGPWEVRIPTSLVVVQNLEEIPGIVDSLTGTNISLG